MQRPKLALSYALLAALAGMAVQAILLLRAATMAAGALPGAVSGELQATRAALMLRSTSRETRSLGRWPDCGLKGENYDFVPVHRARVCLRVGEDTPSVLGK